jgi:hypothetical protein
MKKIFLSLIFLGSVVSLLYSVTIESYGVDGSSGNTNVVIKNRHPIIFWKSDIAISQYIIAISSFSSGLQNGTTVWSVIGSTSSANTIDDITRIECDYDSFKENQEYFFSITVLTFNSTTTVFGSFKTSPTALTLDSNTTNKLFFEVDNNNPFCPKNGETTSFRYKILDKDLNVKIYIFTLSGKYVLELENRSALKDVLYTTVWDGKDSDGNFLPEGMYIATIVAGDYNPISRFVGIVKK